MCQTCVCFHLVIMRTVSKTTKVMILTKGILIWIICDHKEMKYPIKLKSWHFINNYTHAVHPIWKRNLDHVIEAHLLKPPPTFSSSSLDNTQTPIHWRCEHDCGCAVMVPEKSVPPHLLCVLIGCRRSVCSPVQQLTCSTLSMIKTIFYNIINQFYTDKCTHPYLWKRVIYYLSGSRPASSLIRGYRQRQQQAVGGCLPRCGFPRPFDHESDSANKSNASTSKTCYYPLKM